MKTQYIDIMAVGGIRFQVRKIEDYDPTIPVSKQHGELLGFMEFGELDSGQYIGDDDEVIDAARAEYDIDAGIPAGVR